MRFTDSRAWLGPRSAAPLFGRNTNIRTIPHLKELFDCEVGLSDHTLGLGVSVAAVTLGAVIIEKHFTIDKNMYGPDHSCSMSPNELKQIKNMGDCVNYLHSFNRTLYLLELHNGHQVPRFIG